MIRSILLTVLIAFIVSAQPSSWKQVSSCEFKWNEKLPAYKFVLEIPDQWSDPGNFLRMRILPPNNSREFVVIDSGGFVTIASVLNSKKLQNRNLSNSQYLYFSSDLISSDHIPTLILFCVGYASSPGAIHMLQLGKDGYPHEVFSGEFLILDITDVNQDGRKELVGLPALGEVWGRCYETYNPRYVYTYSDDPASPLKYSLELSEKYNRTNYYGWMGPHYSEKIVVVHCAPGKKKPVVMKLEDAEKLFAK
jgi:hypothetical protein